ncbi:MAG: Ig-like domain-containing protein, partial [Kofleriaceae bacterium]
GAAPALFALSARPGSAATATALVTASPQSAQILTAFAQPLVLTVLDAYGNRVPGIEVGFVAPVLPGAQLSADHSTTAEDGTASVLAQADETAGTYLVTATIAGTPDVTFALTNTAATPSSVVITAGGGQKALATTAFAHPVAIRVLDSYGNPVPGVTVTLTVPADGATATMSASTLITDADGAASATLTASSVVGTFTLAAHTAGAFTPGTTTFQIQPIPTTTTAIAAAEAAVDQVAHVAIAVKADLGTPTGTVELVDADGVQVGLATLEDGAATIDVASLAMGTHTLTARFAAQGSYAASASTSVTFTVTGDTGSLSGGGCNAGGGTGGLVVVLAALFALLPRRRAALGVVAVIAAHAGLAGAEPDGARALDRYHAASPDSAWFALDSASFSGERDVTLSFVTDYAKHPLDIYDADGTVREHVVTDAFIIQAGGSVTLHDRLRLSATVPMAAWQDGNGGTYNGMPLASPVFAFGDVSIAGDVRVVGGSTSGLRVATGLRLALPTGSTTNFTSDGVFGVEPRVLAAGSQGPFEYAGEASALLRGESSMAGARFGSELRYAAAAGMRFDHLLVGPELVGAMPLVAHTDVGTPLELQLGAHYTASSHLRIGAGGAVGLINAIGEPRWRLLAALTWTP